MFLNETSGEFLFYNVKVIASEPGILQQIELVTPVRETTSAFIQIDNPTDTPVDIDSA